MTVFQVVERGGGLAQSQKRPRRENAREPSHSYQTVVGGTQRVNGPTGIRRDESTFQLGAGLQARQNRDRDVGARGAQGVPKCTKMDAKEKDAV